ncbi:MAG: tryptophan-rich sensory protein [Parcubacteria group bacterium]|nr:tryptophan-rich sensory protein [Parcubacteria group bacterium]MCR4342399.1 tryptophan-rich sensory protein [Patescibacteria group bacterium]
MRINNFFKLIISIGVSLSAGAIGAVFTTSAIPTWYLGIVKPALNPPAWIFGPVWTTLYVLMGVAVFLIWLSYAPADTEAMAGKKTSSYKKKEIKIAIGVFGIQLFLNAVWSIIFFGLHSPGWALVDIIFLWLAIVWTMIVFYKIYKPATYLLVPYLLWVSFASYLNYSIWMLN